MTRARQAVTVSPFPAMSVLPIATGTYRCILFACRGGNHDGEGGRPMAQPDPNETLARLEEQAEALIKAVEEARRELEPRREPARDRAARRWGMLAPVLLALAWLWRWLWQWRRAAAVSLAGTATTAVMWAVPTPVTDHAAPTYTRTARVHPAVTVTRSTTGTPSSGRPPARTGRPVARHTQPAVHRPVPTRSTVARLPRPSVTAARSLPPGTPTVAPPHVQPSCVKTRVPGLLRLHLVCR